MTISNHQEAIAAINDALNKSGDRKSGLILNESLGILILRLKNSDIINKNKEGGGNSSDIRITSSAEEGRDLGKTGFFPSLTPETPFKGRRIRVEVNISSDNVRKLAMAKGLDASPVLGPDYPEWIQSHLQIRRKSDINDAANPVVMIGYSDDIWQLRRFLYEDDYLIFTKDPRNSLYRAIGLKPSWVDQQFPTGSGAKIAFFSPAATQDPSVFYLGDLLKSDACLLKDRHSMSMPVPKPFILLAGISGTGKSRFVRDQAQKVRSLRSPNNYCSIPVRPDWHEPADLLGYISRIGGEKYVSTEFLKFIVAAWVDATNNDGELIKLEDMTPHWICLDEMNLAPVEQYFSDFLSVLETRENDKDGAYHCDPLLRASELQSLTEESKNKLRDELFAQSVDGEKCKKLFDKFLNDPTWGGIPIPPNLIVAGTVNMDETAHGFSRKVIDRALTFDFQEFFPYEFSRYLKGHPTEIRPLSFPFAFDAREESVRAALKQTADCDGERSVQFIGDLNKVLKDSPFELAYRALNEAILSVACFARGATPANNSVGGSFEEDSITTAADAGQLNGGASVSSESPVETAPTNDSVGENLGEDSITTAAGAEQPNGGASDGSESPDEFALLAAWDDFLMQKVLPRIEGDGAKLKALREIDKSEVKLPPQFGRDTILHQLYKLLAEKLKPIWGSESDDAYESTNAEPTRPDLLRLVEGRKVIPCRSRKKLRWMMQRLKANHFTDFWC